MRIRQLIFKIPKKYLIYKLFNLFKFIIFKNFPNSYAPYKPLTVDIEPATGCNFRCAMYQVSEPNFKASMVESNLLSKSNKCNYPRHNPYVTAQGDIVSCCMIGDSKVNNYGNINNTDFHNIWNSESYKDLRKSIINHDQKDFCKNCYKEKRD